MNMYTHIYIWSAAVAARVGAWENLTLRRMYGLRKLATEHWESYYRRTIRASRDLFRKSHPPIAICVLTRIHSLARQLVVESKLSSLGCLLRSIVEWRNMAWWKACQAVGSTGEGRRASKWRRIRCGKPPLTWESTLVYVWGEGWFEELAWTHLSLEMKEHMFAVGGFQQIGIVLPLWGEAKRKQQVLKQPVKRRGALSQRRFFIFVRMLPRIVFLVILRWL